MTQEFNFYFSGIMYSFMGLIWIVSLLFCYKKYNPSYLRFFPVYHLVAILTELIVNLFYVNPLNGFATTAIPYNLFTLFEFIFFSVFILRQLTNKKYLKVFLVLIFITILISIWFVIKLRTVEVNPMRFLIPICFVYIVGTGLYFINTFLDFKYKNFSVEPAFWIMVGILCYSVTVAPTFFLITKIWEILSVKLYMDRYAWLYVATNTTGYIFLYLFFIRAYTCRIPKARN